MLSDETMGRLLSRLREDENGCWVWMMALDDGYGRMHVGSRTDASRGKVRVHRAVYEYVVGLIPAGLDLDHLCRNRACANPAHLEPVTRRENIMRGEGAAAKASRRLECVNGHPFTVENTLPASVYGSRRCRTCVRSQRAAQMRAYRARKAAENV